MVVFGYRSSIGKSTFEMVGKYLRNRRKVPFLVKKKPNEVRRRRRRRYSLLPIEELTSSAATPLKGGRAELAVGRSFLSFCERNEK